MAFSLIKTGILKIAFIYINFISGFTCTPFKLYQILWIYFIYDYGILLI